MLILALDTTSRAGSVAILRGRQILVEAVGDEAMTHGQRLPSALMEACAGAGVQPSDLELLAVAAGPGSFTGLRIGIATMQGLAMARGLRIVPVSTLEAIAWAAPGSGGRVASWMDAQRGEVFAQVFGRDGSGLTVETEAVSARPADVLARDAAELEGAEFHGDGALRYAAEIRAIRPDAVIAAAVPPLAAAIGSIAAGAPGRAVLPHAVIPIYVRRPDAVIARERRGP